MATLSVANLVTCTQVFTLAECNHHDYYMLRMPRKFRLVHKKSHSGDVLAETSKSCDVYTQTDNDRDTVDVTTQTESDGDCVDVSVQTDMDNESQTVMTQTEDLTLNGCSRAMCDIMSPMPGSRVIQYPLEIFYSLKLESVYQLKQRLRNARCIDNWFILPDDIQAETIKLVKIDGRNVFTIEILPNLQWAACIPNSRLLSNHFKQLPSTITSITELRCILNFFSDCTICSGNSDPKFAPIVAKCKGLFQDRSGQYICNRSIHQVKLKEAFKLGMQYTHAIFQCLFKDSNIGEPVN